MQKDGIASDETGDIGKGHPIWSWDNDVVAFVDHGFENIKDGMLAADVDEALRDVEFRTEITSVLLNDRLPQIANSACSGVFGEIRIDGLNAGLLDVFRCRKIRFARSEVHNVYSLLAEFAGRFAD